MSTPIEWGSEFQLNTTTDGLASAPAIAALASGKFIATWTFLPNGSGPKEIHAQVFNADGTELGTEFRVDGGSQHGKDDPSVVGLSDGRFFTAWTEDTGGDYDVPAHIYNAGGTSSGAQFFVNTTTQGFQTGPDLAKLADGRSIAIWSDQSSGSPDVRAQAFNSDGTKSGSELHVNTTVVDTQYRPVIAALSDGRFVAAWEDHSKPGDDDIRAQIFQADGTKIGAEFIVNPSNGHVDQAPSITALATGGFAIAWDDAVAGADDVSAQVFKPDGSKFGSAFHVNTTTAGLQFNSTLATLANGDVVAAWADQSAGADDIRAQVFDTNGSKVGVEFLVNTTTASTQDEPTITVLADGRFVVGWTDQSPAGGLYAIRAQIFDPRDTPLHIGGTALNDDYVGTKWDDTMKGGGGDDHLAGGAGADTLFGGDGNDTLIGGAGANKLYGDAGDDTAVFSQDLAKYTLTDYSGEILITGPDSSDQLALIEHLQFSDGTVNVDDGNPLFDTVYYMSHNLDVFHAGANALDHFNTAGWHEGRDPDAFFDTKGYLAVNKDVAASGQNPLDHYDQVGWHQGRDPGANFDTTLYLIHNPDVAAAGIDPLAHYLANGLAEGRQAYQAIGTAVNGFDAEYYLFHNPDVAAAGVDPLAHFQANGWQEGRNPNAWFDTAGYLAHYADVKAAGIDPLQHYEQFGWLEGRDPSAGFDTLGYLAANPDVAAAHINPLDHFIDNGIYEGRMAINDGVWH